MRKGKLSGRKTKKRDQTQLLKGGGSIHVLNTKFILNIKITSHSRNVSAKGWLGETWCNFHQPQPLSFTMYKRRFSSLTWSVLQMQVQTTPFCAPPPVTELPEPLLHINRGAATKSRRLEAHPLCIRVHLSSVPVSCKAPECKSLYWICKWLRSEGRREVR